MIDFLDRMLAQVIHNQVDASLFVGFQPPDDDWRTKAIPANANAVNIFLLELRENRRLRVNDRFRAVGSSDISETVAPRRVDCHYLITAWSPVTAGQQLDPTLDEHALLYAIASAFANADPLLALDIFAAAGVPPGFPPILLDDPVPVALLPVEGFHKYAEFWGTMGRHNQPWKPAVYLITTLPVSTQAHHSGPMVTTAMADLRGGGWSAGETFNDFGGTVFDQQVPPQPVPLAWIELLTPLNARLRMVNADANGRFVFTGVPSSTYRLRVTGTNSGPVTRDIDVPSPTGEYDLSL